MGELSKTIKVRGPMATRIGFGTGDFGFVLVFHGTNLFLMYFYTDVLGIHPATAGAIYLIAMVWDAVSDPVFATVVERTRSRWGRYRPWLAFGAIPFGLSYPLAFSANPISAMPSWLWVLITHLIFRTAFTLVAMPFNALQARMTSDANERAVNAGFRMIGAALGALSVAAITPLAVDLFMSQGGQGEAQGYLIAAAIVGFLSTLGIFCTVYLMREPGETTPSVRTSSFLQDLAGIGTMLRRNGLLLRVFAAVIIGASCFGMFGKAMIYFFKYLVERPDLTVLGVTVGAACSVMTIPLWVVVARKTTKRRAILAGASIMFLGYVGFFLTPALNLPLVLFTIALTGVGGSALPVMMWAMLPDTVEYGELKTGIRAEARTFAVASFAQKAALGINALLFGTALHLSGFVPNAVQSDQTLFSIKVAMSLIPAAGAVAIFLIMRGYFLDAKAHSETVKKLAQQSGN